MSRTSQIFVILLTIGTACSTTNTKITSYPNKVGYKRNEYILIAPLEKIVEIQSAELMSMTNTQFGEKFFLLNIVNYWDVQYKSKQFGIVLPSFNNYYDSANLNLILDKLNINYMLLSTVHRIDENDVDGIGNPDYLAREAVVSLQLLDLKNKTIVWRCTTRVRASPLTIKSKDNSQKYSVNVLSAKDYAVNKAFKKSIKRLMRELVIIRQAMI